MSSSNIHRNQREEQAFHAAQKDHFCFLNVMEELNSKCLKTKILIKVCRLRTSEWERTKSLELSKFCHSHQVAYDELNT
jgi:ribonuclease D